MHWLPEHGNPVTILKQRVTVLTHERDPGLRALLVLDIPPPPAYNPGVGRIATRFRTEEETTYGLIPIAIDQGELNHMHGIDERISLDNLRLGTRVVYDVLREVCC
jgi:acetylornithine deacetylase/succinyl-diaminopimelate desuccinylase-like protein